MISDTVEATFSANPFLTGEEQLIPDDDELEEDMDDEEREKRRKL